MPRRNKANNAKERNARKERIEQEITDHLDRAVRDISQEDYRDVLAGLKFNIEVRLEAVEQELENDKT